MNVYVAKNSGKFISEQFDPLKLHRSITAACLAVRAYEGEAHMAAQHTCEKVLRWLNNKTEVTSSDIRRIASEALRIYHPDAAYVYQQYRLMV